MIDSIAYIVAFMITVPFLITLLIYKLSNSLTKNKWYAVRVAADLTTVLYIFSVSCIVYLLFDFNIISYIFLFLLFILAICVIVHWKIYTDIIFVDVWKRFWKTSFLLFFLLHIILMVYGILYTLSDII